MTSPAIQRWRRKPEDPAKRDDMCAVQYQPGMPLDDLHYVARMADADAELAEAVFPAETVLMVRWTHITDGGSSLEFDAVRAGRYLTYSPGYDSLNESSESELRRWYERVEIP